MKSGSFSMYRTFGNVSLRFRIFLVDVFAKNLFSGPDVLLDVRRFPDNPSVLRVRHVDRLRRPD